MSDARGGSSRNGLMVELASFGSRERLARLGAALCATLTFFVGTWWLFRDALPGQNVWASLNSRQTYMERTFPPDEFIGSGRVAEEARLWLPEHARYRVLVGPKYENTPWGWAAPNFLAGFLFPRQQSDAARQWIICLGCDITTAGGPHTKLADGGNGVTLWRAGP